MAVNLYLLEESNLAPIGTTSVNLSDQALTIVRVPVNGTVPTSSTLVVEIFTPDGRNEGNRLLIGSNSAGESASGYLYAPTCNVNNITPLSIVSALPTAPA